MACGAIPGFARAGILVLLLGCGAYSPVVAAEGATAVIDKARAALSTTVPMTRTAATPLFLAHIMPWFQAPPVSGNYGWHWHMGSTDPFERDRYGQRRIASHYYPLTGPYDSSDPALIEYQVLLMKLAGIDGVIVDWYGVSSAFDYAQLHAATQALFTAIRKAGMKFALCYEDQSIGNRVQSGNITDSETFEALMTDLSWAAAHWFGDDAYLTWDGRPVLLDFGPSYVKDPRVWTNLLGSMSPRPFLVTLDGTGASASDGAFSWPPMGFSVKGVLSPDALVAYLNDFHGSNRARPHLVSTAFPGFHDFYSQASVRPSYGYLDDSIGATFRLTLDAALGSRPDIVQVATWNDYGEGTMIEPTVQNGYRDLETLQSFRRRLDPSFPFIREDLRVPLQVWARRIAALQEGTRLDDLVAAVVRQDAAAYRSLLESLGMPAASLPVTLAPVERTFERQSPAPGPAGSVDTYAGAVNLAAHARATANNHIYEFTADKAVDGDVRTYWEGAAKSYPDEITLDLRASQSIAAIRLKLNPQRIWQARTQVFTVLASTDGDAWTPVVPSAGYLFDPGSNVNTVTLPLSVAARYLRLSFTANDGATGAQVAEWEVFGR